LAPDDFVESLLLPARMKAIGAFQKIADKGLMDFQLIEGQTLEIGQSGTGWPGFAHRRK
jgi:hypothetical protein